MGSPRSTKEISISKNPLRWIFLLCGCLFVALASLGIFLPVLPTVPFLLLALWCFANSSQAFHDWLYHHRWFGPPLQNWKQYQVIPLRAKIIAITSMTLSAGHVIGFTNSPPIAIALMLLVMLYGAWFILTKPSRPK